MKKLITQAGASKRFTRLLREVRFNTQALVPAIIQEGSTKQVLTLCYLNKAALRRSLETGFVHVYRRSQKRLVLKGKTSGNVQRIRSICLDCEGKSLLIVVRQHVAACHQGYFSCYFRQLTPQGTIRTLGRRRFDASKVYRE